LNPEKKNPSQKIGLVEWLKVKALSSSSSTTKKRWGEDRNVMEGMNLFKVHSMHA
jgi:hypothetical protein